MKVLIMRHRLTVLAGLALTGCVSPSAPVEPANSQTSDGRYLVEKYCAACHAIGRTDRSKHPDAPALRTLSQSYPVRALEESLAEGIMVGHPDMPEFKFGSEDDAAIISYLESIQDR